MPVQRLNETSKSMKVSEGNPEVPMTQVKNNLQEEEAGGSFAKETIYKPHEPSFPPQIPERTSASNLDQFKTSDNSPNHSTPLRRITSPSSRGGPNPWNARKTSFQSERIVPNDDLALSRARAAGTRNYSQRVSNPLYKLRFDGKFCCN